MTSIEKAKKELNRSLRQALGGGFGEYKDGVISGIEHCIEILDTIK